MTFPSVGKNGNVDIYRMRKRADGRLAVFANLDYTHATMLARMFP